METRPSKSSDFLQPTEKTDFEAKPNPAHQLIADMESDFDVHVITQNIDDLHERAGSTKVIHLHGNITYSKSSGPNQEKAYYPINGWELKLTDLCPEGYPLRPHVVWFGEAVPMMERAFDLILEAEILIVIGTPLQVYPAAGLVHAAKKKCQKYIIDPGLNKKDVPEDFMFIQKTASEGLRYIYEHF